MVSNTKVKVRKATDPVTGYLYRQTETYGLGYIPEDLGGQTPDQILEEVRARTRSSLSQLFGPHITKMTGMVGMDRHSLRHVEGALTTQATIYHLRMVGMTMLAHIGGIRQQLTDIEREIWVTMQLSHHPAFEKDWQSRNGKTPRAVEHMLRRKRIREEIGNVKGRPKTVPLTWLRLLPTRAVSLIKHPELPPHEAFLLQTQKEIEENSYTKHWKGTALYPKTGAKRKRESNTEPLLAAKDRVALNRKIDRAAKPPQPMSEDAKATLKERRQRLARGARTTLAAQRKREKERETLRALIEKRTTDL